jgi:phosphoribosylformimino-5-aminoimidazole carboxamide ribotide isomerase
MIIYPAIDLRGGKVVRLNEGDPDRQITFSDDPIATAQHWIDQGAEWLHIVNLDGAFDQDNDNLAILKEIATLNTPIQFGGGLRDLSQIENALKLGASRVILGTVAVEEPDIIRQSVQLFGNEAVCIGLDARDGKIATKGWQHITELTPAEFGKFITQQGGKHALYTDVSRDGSLEGVDVDGTSELAQTTGLKVIASGGVRDIQDIELLLDKGNVAGVIIGMALYRGKIDLKEAIQLANGGR